MIQVTEVSLTLAPSNVEERDGILAFARIVLGDCFAVKDIKMMRREGKVFLGMPSRKITDRCQKCGGKNAILDAFCNQCGQKREPPQENRRLFADSAYPINREFRQCLEEAIGRKYNEMVSEDKQVRW